MKMNIKKIKGAFTKLMILEYICIDNKYDNVKDVIKSQFHISDRLISKLKKSKHILVNSKPVYITTKINIGDKISIDLDFEEISENIVPTKMNLNIIFEDDSMIIINKPSNTPVHPSFSHFSDSLSNGIQYYFDTQNIKRKIRPVNRLDKDTSGLVIFAKNEYIQESLISQMKNGLFQKEYLAILDGVPDEILGIISAPISRKENSIIEREINFQKRSRFNLSL